MVAAISPDREDLVRRTSVLGRPALFATACGLLAATLLPTAASAAPTIRAQSWYLKAMNVEAAQKVATGKGVTVAVIDTGVNPDIPALSGQVLPGYDPGGGDGRSDRAGHGTSMAALIAGKGGSPDTLLGVAPGAKILPVMLSPTEDHMAAPHGVIEQLVHWSIDHGARVVSMSFSVPDATRPDDPWKRNLVKYATDHRAVLVASAGNRADGSGDIGRPGDIPGVVTVTGLGRDGKGWSGSVTGQNAAIAAPAEQITFPTGLSDRPTETASGTSGSAALVAGELALIMSRYPGVSSADAINRLIASAHDLGAKGRDPVYGYGSADAAAALTRDVPTAGRNPLLATSDPAAAEAEPSSFPVATVVLVALLAAVLLLVVVVVVVVVVRRRGGPKGPNGGGGGGGPGGPPPYGPGPGPTGYGQPPNWQQAPQAPPRQPERLPSGAPPVHR